MNECKHKFDPLQNGWWQCIKCEKKLLPMGVIDYYAERIANTEQERDNIHAAYEVLCGALLDHCNDCAKDWALAGITEPFNCNREECTTYQALKLSPTETGERLAGLEEAAKNRFKMAAPTCCPENCLECSATVNQCPNVELGRALAKYRGGEDNA